MDQEADENKNGKMTGRRHVTENSKFQRDAIKGNARLRISQGLRRRHPDRVLNQFRGISETTGESASLWEKALLYEDARVQMPKEFRVVGDSDGMTNQMGVVSVALDNYKASKQKFSRLHLVGV